MADANIVYCQVGFQSQGTEKIQIWESSTAVAETLTGVAASTATAVPARNNDVARIVAIGGPIWVATGENPTAAAGSGWRIEDGNALELGMTAGHSVAAING